MISTTTKTVAICDLNNAVAAKDKESEAPISQRFRHTEICLLAQFAHRVTGERVTGSTQADVAFESNPDFYKFHVYSQDMRKLVEWFDLAYQAGHHDEYYIARIREQLPMEVQVTIEER